MSDKKPSESEGKLFNRYHTRAYINDKTDFGEEIEKRRLDAGREEFPDGGFLGRAAHSAENKKPTYDKGVGGAPAFFGELRKKYQPKEISAENEAPKAEDYHRESLNSTLNYISEGSSAPASSPYRDEGLIYGEYISGANTDSAESFFGAQRAYGGVKTREKTQGAPRASSGLTEEWTPVFRESVSRKEIAADALEFSKLYDTPKQPRAESFADYDNFLRKKSEAKDTGVSPEAADSRELEQTYSDYLESKSEKQKSKALSVTLESEAGEESYRRFITRREQRSELSSMAQRAEQADALAEYERAEGADTFTFIKRGARPASERDELEEIAKNEAARVNFEQMSKSDLADSLKRLGKGIASAKRRKRRADRRIKGSSESDRIKPICDYLNASRELMELLAEGLVHCICADSRFRKRKYSSTLNNEAKDFNRALRVWCAMTASSMAPIPSAPAKDLERGTPLPRIPEFSPPEKRKVRLSSEDREERYREAMELLRDEKEWKKRSGGVARIYAERLGDVYTDKGVKAHIKLDKSAVKARIEYRIEKLEQAVMMDEFRLGGLTHREASAKRRLEHMLSVLKRGKRRAVRQAAEDSKRYFAIIQPKRPKKLKRGADRERMEELEARISSLILERDEVNQQLLALYTGRDVADRGSKSAAQSKITRARKRGAARGFREQKKIYKKVRKFRVPERQKERIYELINKKTELLAYLSECKYRMKFKGRQDPERRYYAKEIRRTRREIRYATRDINALTKRNERRSDKKPDPKIQLLWLLLLILLVAGGVFAYLWFSGNLTWL